MQKYPLLYHHSKPKNKKINITTVENLARKDNVWTECTRVVIRVFRGSLHTFGEVRLFTPTNHLNVIRVFFSAVWPSKIQVCVSEIIDPTLELRLRVEGHVAPGLASDGVSSS